MAKGNAFDALTSAFHSADSAIEAPNGFAGFNINHKSGKPMGPSKPQTPAQHDSVEKAAKVSASKRKASAMLKGRLA